MLQYLSASKTAVKLLPVLVFLFSFQGFGLNQKVDSLLHVLNSENKPDSVLFATNFQLAWELKSTEPTKAMDYAREALKIAENLQNDLMIANSLSYIGVIYWQMGSFEQAMNYHLDALSIYSDINDPIGIARSNTNIGIILSDQSYYERALEYFFKALKIYENNNSVFGLSVVLNNIGEVYEHQKDYDLAEEYHLSSLKIKEESGDAKGIAFSYNNLGLVYQGQNMLEKAREYFYKALEIREELDDKREVANTTSNLGYLYLLTGNYISSKAYLDRSLALYEEVDDKGGIARSLNYLGKLHLKTNDRYEAERYFTQSLEIAKEIGMNKLVADNFSDMANFMAAVNNYQQAYYYQNLFIKMKDSVYSEDSRRKVIELQLMYDKEKKESEIQIIEKNEQINFLSSQRDKLLRNFLIASVILVLISLFLLYNRFLIAKKSNELLEKQKDEITQSNKKLISLNHSLLDQKKKFEELNNQLNISNQKLKESEKNLIEINSTKDKFFSIISHDLRNPFAAIVSFSRILKRDITNLSTDELNELALELDKSVLKINNLLENLLQWSRTQTGKIKYKPEYIAVHEIVKDNLMLFRNNAREKEISMIDKVDDNTPVWADRNMTDTVIRNLLSNALKYTDSGGKIIISSEIKNHKVYISVEDNGVGMSEESKNKIFRIDTLHSTYGTMDEKGSGLGLLLCKEFVEKQGGEISFVSEPNVGTTFTFTLPIDEIK
jgi:signal transduction histidine kinase/Flp pilus assembly protein TadD